MASEDNIGPLLQLAVRPTVQELGNGDTILSTIDSTSVDTPRSYINLSQFIFEFDRQHSVIVPMQGDIIRSLKLRVKLPKFEKVDGSYADYTDCVAFALFSDIELRIGETMIDIFDSNSLYLFNSRSDICGSYSTFLTPQLISGTSADDFLYCDLPFDILRHGLPLSRLSELKVLIRTRKFSDIIVYDGEIEPEPVIPTVDLVAEYMWLPNKVKQLLEQQNSISVEFVQKRINELDIKTTTRTIRFNLDFIRQPCRMLYIVFQDMASISNNDYFNYTIRNEADVTNLNALLENQGRPFIKTVSLLCDGKYRFKELDETKLRLNEKGNYNVYSIRFDENCKEKTTLNKIDDNSRNLGLNFSAFFECDLFVSFQPYAPDCRMSVIAECFNLFTMGVDRQLIAF